MNIIINTNMSPMMMGKENYDQYMFKHVQELKNIIPELLLYKNKDYENISSYQCIVVPDNFSFGIGGAMRKETKTLINNLFCSNNHNITFILLEPSCHIDHIIQLSTQLTFRDIDTFKMFYPNIKDLLKKGSELNTNCMRIIQKEKAYLQSLGIND
jgi:hypothetical protein